MVWKLVAAGRLCDSLTSFSILEICFALSFKARGTYSKAGVEVFCTGMLSAESTNVFGWSAAYITQSTYI
jgi:hypothetical protein